jgi:hypothetical protein
MTASFYRLPAWYKKLLQLRGEDPLVASKNLIVLSNSSNSESAEPHISRLKKSLRIAPELDI